MTATERQWMTTWTLQGKPRQVSLRQLLTAPACAFASFDNRLTGRHLRSRVYAITRLFVDEPHHWYWHRRQRTPQGVLAETNPEGYVPSLQEAREGIRQDLRAQGFEVPE